MAMEIDPKNVQKVCLVVIDGWGLTTETKGNAIHHAKTPVMDKLMKNSVSLHASESYVGSLEGVMGSSKVGHINIGAGRLVWQDMAVMAAKKKEGTFLTEPGFVRTLEHAKKYGRIHMLGLVSDGGVHSHIGHLKDYMKAAKDFGIPHCFVHFFADGRDSKAKSAGQYIKELTDFMDQEKYGKIATLMGRATAMDRDNNWNLTEHAYQVMVHGERAEECPIDQLQTKVAKMQESINMDEALAPLLIDKEGLIKDNDTLLFFNFRADRMVQIVSTFELKVPKFEKNPLKNLKIYCSSRFSTQFPYEFMLPIVPRKNCLSEWISLHNLKQFHSAETEKFHHVTTFFNEPNAKEFKGEVWDMVSSPEMPYNGKPRMSADGVGEKMVNAILSGEYHFFVCNLAPPDMIGHTGSFEETVIACEATDQVIGKMLEACEKMGVILVVTSDHGNAESMFEHDGLPCPKHTFNRVPFCVSVPCEFTEAAKNPKSEFSLKDVAPTVLKLMKLTIPQEMNGIPLVK